MKIKIISASLILLECLMTCSACISKEYAETQFYNETLYITENATETYSKNENTVVDTVSEEYKLYPLFNWRSQDLSFKGTPYLWYYAYNIPDLQLYDNARVRITIWDQLQYEQEIVRVFDVSKSGHIYTPDPIPEESDAKGLVSWTWITGKSSLSWLDTANTVINQAKFLGGRVNVWSKPDGPHNFEMDIGKAKNIAVVISGPQYQWNAIVAVNLILQRNIMADRPVIRERQVSKQVPQQVQKQKTIIKTKQVPFWEAFLSR